MIVTQFSVFLHVLFKKIQIVDFCMRLARSSGGTRLCAPPQCLRDLFAESGIAKRKIAIGRVPDLIDHTRLQLMAEQFPVCRAARIVRQTEGEEKWMWGKQFARLTLGIGAVA